MPHSAIADCIHETCLSSLAALQMIGGDRLRLKKYSVRATLASSGGPRAARFSSSVKAVLKGHVVTCCDETWDGARISPDAC